MHTAYRTHQLLKLPLTIESVLAFSDNLLVGTKEGHLLMYSVQTNEESNEQQQQPQVQLLRTNKNFSRNKPISQLAVVPEYSIMVALCDGAVTVHDTDMAVTNFPAIYNVRLRLR